MRWGCQRNNQRSPKTLLFVFRRFACRSAAFLSVWGSQPKREASLFNLKFLAARVRVYVRQLADGRAFAAVCGQPVFEVGVVGADEDGGVFLVKIDFGGLFLLGKSCSHRLMTAIIGWSLSDTLDTGYVIQAVGDVVAAHGAPAILNSDQGCQFTSNAYKTLLRELRIRQSMDGKSRWADNVMIERWFRSLKTEEIYLNEYPNPRALRKAISVYIQQYNTVRPHQALEYKTPESVYPNY